MVGILITNKLEGIVINNKLVGTVIKLKGIMNNNKKGPENPSLEVKFQRIISCNLRLDQ